MKKFTANSFFPFLAVMALVIILAGCGKETTQTSGSKETSKTTENKNSGSTQDQAPSKTETQTGELFFDVTNNTGLTLVDVFVSPAEENHWGNDILPNNLFENGSTIRITLPAEFGKTCMFDMKITDGADGHITFKNIDACKLIKLKINSDATFDYLQTK